MRNILENAPWFRVVQDIIDIFLVTFLIYSIFRLIRGTRTVNMLIGLGICILVYYLSSVAELYTLNWILYHFFESLLIIVVILFQNEIRRFLTRMGQTSLFSLFTPIQDEKTVDEIVRCCIMLANKRVGALIVIEKEDGIGDYVELGTQVDAIVTKEILMSIFLPSSILHDGAVMIQKGRISYASCFLPLSMNPKLDSDLGTRHRAGLGLSEETDALVVIVSEQNGYISVAIDGKIVRGVDGLTLRSMLNDQLRIKVAKEKDRHEAETVIQRGTSLNHETVIQKGTSLMNETVVQKPSPVTISSPKKTTTNPESIPTKHMIRPSEEKTIVALDDGDFETREHSILKDKDKDKK